MTTPDHQIPAGMVLRAIVDQGREEAISDGLKNAVHAYYDNYTDATELHGEFFRAIETICRHTLEYSLDVNEIVYEAEEELREVGRQVKTVEDPNAEDEDDD